MRKTKKKMQESQENMEVKQTTCRVNAELYSRFRDVCEIHCMNPKALIDLFLKEWADKNEKTPIDPLKSVGL